MIEWTEHRFSGGLLALDVANSVVWRDIDGKSDDRFEKLEDVKSFARAASGFRKRETEGRSLPPPRGAKEHKDFLKLRDSIDAWLRPQIRDGAKAAPLAPLFSACAKASQGSVLAEATARSAMLLLNDELRARVKICPACRWFFLDRSKNQSRHWCDMKVCGNRAKAGRHYRKNKGSMT